MADQMSESEQIRAYGGYFSAGHPANHDQELLETGPGTRAGEYLRRFWHPICLSSELTDLPLAVRHMGEDLVTFRYVQVTLCPAPSQSKCRGWYRGVLQQVGVGLLELHRK